MNPWVMSASTTSQEPPDRLVEILDELDAPTLRGVRSYAEQRLDDLRPPLEELIRSEADGEIVDIDDRGAYTLVRKCPPVGAESETTSRPLHLYRVKREERLDGEETLHWSYLGEVTDRADVECGNCGTLVPAHETACPHCREEIPRDEER